MTTAQDTMPADKDGKYKFIIDYSGREVSCQVEKEHDMLHVIIDENLSTELKINTDGSVTKIAGADLPQSSIDYIKKQVLGHS